MNKYLVIRSFSGPAGAYSEGDVVELTDEQARGFAAFLQPIQREVVEYETADLPVEKAEKAIKIRKKKGE